MTVEGLSLKDDAHDDLHEYNSVTSLDTALSQSNQSKLPSILVGASGLKSMILCVV